MASVWRTCHGEWREVREEKRIQEAKKREEADDGRAR